MAHAYRNYVDAQYVRRPCFGFLHDFLHTPRPRRGRCRVVEFDAWSSDRQYFSMETAELAEILRAGPPAAEDDQEITTGILKCTALKRQQGRLLFVENINTEITELLGSALRIDSAFFASHVDAPKISFDARIPETVVLPSQRKSRQHLNIHHYQAFLFDKLPDSLPKTILLECNVDRKLDFLSLEGKRKTALARRVVSILRLPPGSKWEGLILTDPPVSTKLYCLGPSRRLLTPDILGEPRLWLGGYEDFTSSHPSRTSNSVQPLSRNSLLDDPINYWTQQAPPDMDLDEDMLLHLCHYPLKIVTGEWMIYSTVVDRSIKQYEYSSKDFSDFNQALNKLDMDIKALQSWRRRVMNSQQRIKALSIFLSRFDSSTTARELQEDLLYVSCLISECGRILETTIPLVTSFVQIIDSRRAFAEATNITRLTVLALTFVPLSFVSSLFSMNTAVAPGGRLF